MALQTFSHDDINLHDYEMSLGADRALCLNLGYVLGSTSPRAEEISLICECLIHVYSCSSEHRRRSFWGLGEELVPLLVRVLMVFLPADLGTKEEHDALPVLQILRIYAKLDYAKSFLIRYNCGAWIAQLVKYILADLEQRSRLISTKTFTEILGLIKDLSFRSHTTDKELLLQTEGGIFQNLLLSCCELQVDSNLTLLEWFTALIWNLVLDNSVCTLLLNIKDKSAHPIVAALLKILSSDVICTGKQSVLLTKTRRNATSALGNILSDPRNGALLFPSETTAKSFAILPTLMKLVEKDSDSIVRRRAMKTLRCIASSTDPNIQICIAKEQVAVFLVDTIARNVSQDDDNDKDMQIQACQTVNLLVEAFEDSDWPSLEIAITQRIETTNDTELTIAACECLVECVLRSPWRRGSSCFSEMFWKRLETAASVSKETHDCIAKLLLQLIKIERKAGSVASSGQPSPLTCPNVVNILTALISDSGPNSDETRNIALEVILILVQDDLNRKPLAENEGLLSGLVNLCLLQPDPKTKYLAKQVILDLVPEL